MFRFCDTLNISSYFDPHNQLANINEHRDDCKGKELHD